MIARAPLALGPAMAIAALLGPASLARAQDHVHHQGMHGMAMPPAPPQAATPEAASPATVAPETASSATAPEPAAPDMPATDGEPRGTDQSPGSADPPPVSHDLAAERFFGRAAMEQAHHAMMGAHGGGTQSQVRFDLAEVQVRRGAEGFRWEALAWTGGDIDRFVLRSEGEGTFGARVERAEVQALWHHAIDPWWNVEAGVRQDLESGPRRTHAVIALEGLAPMMWDVRAQAFLSQHGELTGRVEATIDQRLTNRLVLRPRVEAAWSAQDARALRMGPGLAEIGLGLRLHALIKPEFAPYVGWNWTRRIGRTAGMARAEGESASSHALVVGIATWF